MNRKFYNLETTTSRNVFAGNGVTVAFTTDFAFIQSDTLDVTLVSALGVETAQVENTNYTVTGGINAEGEPDTGTVTMIVAPASGARLVVERSEAYVQPSTFERFGRLPIKVIELCLDRVTLLCQQLLDLSNRTLHYPSSEPVATSGALPAKADRLGKFLAFDAVTGEPVVVSGSADSITVSPFAATLLDDTDAAAARTTLGISAFGATLIDDADAAAARATLGITAASAFMQTVLDDADAAAARATLGLGYRAVDTMPTLGKMVGATTSYTVLAADQGIVMLASPNAAATLTFNMIDVDTVPAGAIFAFTNSGPTAPVGNVEIVLNAGDTFMGSSGNINLVADEVLFMWPDSPTSHNWLGFSSKPAGVRQQNVTEFTTQISTVSTVFVTTGFSIVLPERLQTKISREYVEFHGVISADVTNRVVTFGIHDGTSVVAQRAFSPTDSNNLMPFRIRYRNTGLRASNTPTTFTLHWKTNAGTAWLNRQASAATANCAADAEVIELPIC